MSQVYWITGLSGSGKTTVGRELYQMLKRDNPAVVFLDGDTLREVAGDAFGYSPKERRRCAMFYSRLCRLLAEQGMTVICCTVSMFDSVREWNRENIPGYFEVYLKVPMEVLRQRDQKQLYSGVEAGSSDQVTGVSIAWEEPKAPDVIIKNDGRYPPEEAAEQVRKYSASFEQNGTK